ncbi:hypothetical protein AKJ42_02620 [candidate division MSBL1 archaeon SCGC-AAA261C02]|uniref:type I site-specific deoxyribonuclease n=1 Tax=candidate division MSBL1 archaeon SCGC-AAA261C02 TaxID=1698272 RepID=A0A133UZW1_9EURY|nr:hypothetical protein AKJ42_02620 [candidate division MSBL1 archaeon SCGC-AAA261C02]
MSTFTEKTVVEDYIVDRLQGMNWKFVKSTELGRDSYEEVLLLDNLRAAVRRINDIRLGEEDLEKVVNKLDLESSGVEGVKQILRFLKEGISIKLEEDESLERIKLLDEDLEGNEFIVSRQVTYKSYDEEIRPDVVLYVNGIPLVVIECKNPADPTVSWETAYDQVKAYENKVPELFKYVQFSIAAEETAKYFPNTPWLEKSHIYEWKEEEFDVLEATLGMLQKDTLLDLIQNYVFVREERGKSTKIMARYLQYRASKGICDRVINNLRGEEDKNSGLIWHWQGSGKTLTMIFAMNKLYHHPLLENPTIFFVLDRTELEDQIKEEISALDISVDIERVQSIKHLRKVLLHDEGKGKRGVFATLIQKFRKDDLRELERELNERKSSGKRTILDRKNVIGFVDEGHRTQYGVLAAEMRKILNNAFFFAFTGTPIAKEGRDTFDVFSYPDEKYLDRYFIQDSIEDGFTVPIKYQARLEGETYVSKEDLQYFLQQELEEIPEELREDVEEKTRRKLSTINVFLKNPERVDMVANDIASHFLEKIDEKFKGMVVTADRRACMMYKNALDKYLPSEYSEVVMSFGANDPKEFTDYLAKLKDKYNARDWDRVKSRITTSYKEEEFPKILIVTNMLLTGFDAPILQAMYLDKPLKEHRLLQAIARTNRPFNGVKEAGLILDYVGIFDEFERTLAIYSKGDVEGAAYNIDTVREEFLDSLKKARELFEDIGRGDDRETLMKVIRKLVDENTGEEFQRIYRDLRKKFELLGPDPFKTDYLDEFKWFTNIYVAYLRHIKRVDPDQAEKYAKRYFKNTLDYLHKELDLDKIRKDFPIISFDEEYLDRLEDEYPDLDGRISDISTTFVRFIKPNRTKNPIYGTVADKVERILRKWNERRKLLEGREGEKFKSEVYQELKQALGEFDELKNRQVELGLNSQEYYLLLILEKHLEGDLVRDSQELSKEILSKTFKNWTLQPSAVKSVGRTVRKFLRKYDVSGDRRNEVYDEIMEMLERSE